MFDELVQTAVQCEKYRQDNYRLKRERDVPQDYKKEIFELRGQVNNLERLVQAIQKVQTKLLNFVEDFLQKRNIDVSDFKLEYKEMEVAEQQREQHSRSRFFESQVQAQDDYDEIVHRLH
jgi:hypothetical protein